MNYKVTDIVNAEPCYTGGGIYAIVGELADGNHFMGDLTFHWIAVVNEEPDWEESWYEEWINAHSVTEFNEEDSLKFIKVALEWVTANKPDGNYLVSDMDRMLAEIRAEEEAEEIILSSKDLAEKHDRFDDAVISAIHTLAESISGKTLDKDALWDTAYIIGFLPPIEELAESLIKDAYKITYESDGTSF